MSNAGSDEDPAAGYNDRDTAGDPALCWGQHLLPHRTLTHRHLPLYSRRCGQYNYTVYSVHYYLLLHSTIGCFDFWGEKQGTRQVVRYCFRTPIPKSHSFILLFYLEQCLRKFWLLPLNGQPKSLKKHLLSLPQVGMFGILWVKAKDEETLNFFYPFTRSKICTFWGPIIFLNIF